MKSELKLIFSCRSFPFPEAMVQSKFCSNQTDNTRPISWDDWNCLLLFFYTKFYCFSVLWFFTFYDRMTNTAFLCTALLWRNETRRQSENGVNRCHRRLSLMNIRSLETVKTCHCHFLWYFRLFVNACNTFQGAKVENWILLETCICLRVHVLPYIHKQEFNQPWSWQIFNRNYFCKQKKCRRQNVKEHTCNWTINRRYRLWFRVSFVSVEYKTK